MSKKKFLIIISIAGGILLLVVILAIVSFIKYKKYTNPKTYELAEEYSQEIPEEIPEEVPDEIPDQVIHDEVSAIAEPIEGESDELIERDDSIDVDTQFNDNAEPEQPNENVYLNESPNKQFEREVRTEKEPNLEPITITTESGWLIGDRDLAEGVYEVVDITLPLKFVIKEDNDMMPIQVDTAEQAKEMISTQFGVGLLTSVKVVEGSVVIKYVP